MLLAALLIHEAAHIHVHIRAVSAEPESDVSGIPDFWMHVLQSHKGWNEEVSLSIARVDWFCSLAVIRESASVRCICFTLCIVSNIQAADYRMACVCMSLTQ